MEDLRGAVVSHGIVVMREWKIKDAQVEELGRYATGRSPCAWHSVTKRYKQFQMKL